MIDTTPSRPSPAPMTLDYRLLEADIHHYGTSGWTDEAWQTCWRRKTALLLLGSLGSFLLAICYHDQDARSVFLALGSTLIVLAGLAWARRDRKGRATCRLARQMGVPRDVRLSFSTEGIADETDPTRTFAWSEVVGITRVDHLTVLRLGHAGSVVIVPDRAFLALEIRSEFVRKLREWQDGSSIRRAIPSDVHPLDEDLGRDHPGGSA